MLKKIAKAGLQLLPDNVQNKIKGKVAISNWEKAGKPIPVPHAVKQSMIEKYKLLSDYNVLVETGTFMGDMVEAQRKRFAKVYSIELSEQLWKDAVKRFENYGHIKILQGDSGKVLGTLVQTLQEPAIFWLDGHYSAGNTAMGEKECPIFEEIDGIFDAKKQKHVLLIDDARLFVGERDYPKVDELTKYIKAKDERYEVVVENDVICYTIK